MRYALTRASCFLLGADGEGWERPWVCAACTFAGNAHADARCDMCGTARGGAAPPAPGPDEDEPAPLPLPSAVAPHDPPWRKAVPSEVGSQLTPVPRAGTSPGSLAAASPPASAPETGTAAASETRDGAAGAGGGHGDSAARERTPKRPRAEAVACVDNCDTDTQGPGLRIWGPGYGLGWLPSHHSSFLRVPWVLRSARL